MYRFIDAAITGAERGAALTKRMLAFARRQELAPQTVELHGLVDGIAEMLRRSIGPNIHVAVTFSPEVPPIRVDPNQLELALLNLALNARDAMAEGGKLSISAAREQAPADLTGNASGDFVCISVSDTGDGMDETTLKRAAEPFYTTKGVGKGTGLGLSMVHGLTAQSGGAMRLFSRLGEGTTVKLWFPVAAAHEGARAKHIESAPKRSRPCRILLVDDDPLVLASTAAMLEDDGHSVATADSGRHALEALRVQVVDIVITDQAMPEMTGIDLARNVRRIWPSLPVILVSGHPNLPASDELRVPCLAKPFHPAALQALIAGLIDPAPPLVGATPPAVSGVTAG
jgi:CheY-like chemotaxis protein